MGKNKVTFVFFFARSDTFANFKKYRINYITINLVLHMPINSLWLFTKTTCLSFF